MPEFDRNPDLSDRQRLATFVEEVHWLLGWLIEMGSGPEDRIRFDPELHELMLGAWEDVQPEFRRLVALTMDAPQERLVEHGLVGPQLRFKLRVVTKWWDHLMEFGGRGTLKWLIDMIDNVMESLIEAVGAGGAVKEFKDALMGSVEA